MTDANNKTDNMNKLGPVFVSRLSQLYGHYCSQRTFTKLSCVTMKSVSWSVCNQKVVPFCPACFQLQASFHTTSINRKTNSKKKRPLKKVNRPPKPKAGDVPVIPVHYNMTVSELADRINTSIDNVFEMMLYIDDHNTDRYDKPRSVIDNFEVLTAILKKFGYKYVLEVKKKAPPVDKDAYKQPPADPADLVKRPPVVTIMGHVDHGKTTLLDALRKSNVVASEFGGITQHIGAFSVTLKDGGRITFLDTPGHAAFSAMRARGARATDIVVLVVAADDGVMNQTVESIEHALQADVPVIVAVNKMDKPGADIEKTKNDLLQHGIQLEGYGGSIQAVQVSALKGTNLPQLQDAILAEAEILELKTDARSLVEGVVIESKTDPGRGKLSTALIQRGTLKKGAFLVAGTSFAKVKGMLDENGKRVEKAEPGTAVEIMGWQKLPSAGDEILEVKNEARMKEVIHYREDKEKERRAEADQSAFELKMAAHNAAYKEHLKRKLESGNLYGKRFAKSGQPETQTTVEKPKLSIVIKGDVDGSVEAILDTLSTYESDLCDLDLVHFGVGMINESDIELAESFNGVIYAFNVNCPVKIAELANERDIPIKKHNIIYRLMEDLVEELTNTLPTRQEEELIGEADVLEIFVVSEGKRKVNVAGCRCSLGMLSRRKRFRLLRNGEVIFDGNLASLKHLKTEVETIKMGVECGLKFEDKELNIERGDLVICYDLKDVEQTIDWEPHF